MKNTLNNHEYKSFAIKILIILWFAIWIFLLYKVLNVILVLILSLFLSIIFSPFLNKLNKLRIGNFTWIIIIFFILFLVLLLVMVLIIPLIINQSLFLFSSITAWANNILDIYISSWIEWLWLPKIVENIISNLNIEQVLNIIKDNSTEIWTFLWANLKTFITGWAWIIFSIGWFIFNFVLTFLFTFFILLERKSIRKWFYAILPKNISLYLYENEINITKVLTEWLKWQIILAISIFVLTFIWLLILKIVWINIQWIFTLSLIAWFMELIPYIWIFISLFLALSISIWDWINVLISILILYTIIQQVEWNFFVPYIMWRSLSLSPFIVLVSTIIWWALFWIMWIIFTAPVVSIIDIFIRPYIKKRKKENKI